MSVKKTVSMIFKTLNYTNEIKKKSTNGHGGRRQLFKSLRHSLRIPVSSPKKLEWIDDQSHLNLIWFPNTGTVKLDDFPKDQREALLARITDEAEAPTIANDNRSELLELRTKLKNKVKNASKQETDEATILAFQNILNVKGLAEIDQLLADLDQFDIKRKSQKLSTARQFLDCHNEIERDPKPLIKKNQAVIQEAFFKFPSKNQVEGLTGHLRIDLIKDFYKAVFPEYPIHFVVLHGDEDADLTDHSDHPHIFISTKSSKTGRYDLRETQINKVNSYLQKHRTSTALISEKPDYLESQILFGHLQDMFYAFTNNRLLKETPYFAKKNSKAVAHMSKLRSINDESKKPKSEREFSLYQLVKEKRGKASEDLELARKQAAEAKTYTQKVKRYASVQLSQAEQATKVARDAAERQKLAEQATVEELGQVEAYRRRSSISQQEIDRNNAELIRIQAKIASQIAQLQAFKKNLSDLIDGILSWIDECFSKKRQTLQGKYIDQARNAFERIYASDNTDTKAYINAAVAQIDKQLSMLEEYRELFPDLQGAEEIKRNITSPKAAF